MSSIALRTVACEGGPLDGAEMVIAVSVSLPDEISFPRPRAVAKRDVYRLVRETEELATYVFDHAEVRG